MPDSLIAGGYMDITDRFLEISNIYHHKILHTHAKPEPDERLRSDRVARLMNLVETAEIQEDAESIREITVEQALGQSVAPTPAFLEETRLYQERILARLDNDTLNVATPRNRKMLRNLLRQDPRGFLSSFETVSYAWDILTELGSISLLPSWKAIQARDTVYMHAVELHQHLRRIYTQAVLSAPDGRVSIGGEFSLKDLTSHTDKWETIAGLVDSSAPSTIHELIDAIIERSRILEPNRTILAHCRDAINFTERVYAGDVDILAEPVSGHRLVDTCNETVIYGLAIAYAACLTRAEVDQEEHQKLRMNGLFCTRILLDESRWFVCSKVARVVLDICIHLNRLRSAASLFEGTYMIQANLFHARKMSKEDVTVEVQGWDVEQVHPRYKFLQYILLDRYGEAAEIARTLSCADSTTGRPNMSAAEFREWPILEQFRQSEAGIEFLDRFQTARS